ncbi:hypothetical protein F511_42859 [Dorcoceras hygrometricum]|uniref:Retrotransposon Copia-like N-terminal domain-containing protein n=1 Tax=Dorcoceras hygrometricum TaxID=472368 RepID=A0A2Z7CF45_9LAMI|nr:hypothetical protein F511_42859 [Dorcoceras hygrometricum]
MSGLRDEKSVDTATQVMGQKLSEVYTVSPTGLDHQSVNITIHKLNGKNFLEWALSIKLIIEGKGRLGYLTGDT